MTVNDRVRVISECWAKGFLGTIVTVDASLGFVRYGVRPDPDCAAAKILWFRDGELAKVSS